MFKKALKSLLLFILLFVFSSVMHVLCVGFFHVTWTPLIVIRNNKAVSTNPEYSPQQHYIPLDSISPNLILAVMCAEDQKFPKHNGFDFEAIEKAIVYNKKNENKRGASTISQQTAKNVFMWPGKNLVRKGFEAYYTFLIETLWSKKRIMEAYLNVIEMGDGIYGADAAAHYYYDKPAAELTEREAASIAAVLPNPILFNPLHLNEKMMRKRQNIIKFMHKYKHLLDELGLSKVDHTKHKHSHQ